MTSIIRLEDVKNRIIEIRKQKVLLDFDVASLYDVETREINQAVKNNPEKFPKDYLFTLTKEEKNEVIKNFDNLERVKFSPKPPNAFTERGLYMLATILKGDRATQTTIAIIDTFTSVKNLTRNLKEISLIKDEKSKKNLMQKSGEIISEIFEDDLLINETETSIELNFAIIKIKHTVKKKK